MVVLSMSCMSVLASVWILSIHHQRGKPNQVPKWLRCIVLRFLATLFCVNIQPYSPKYSCKCSKSRVSTDEHESIRLNKIRYGLIEMQNKTNVETLENNYNQNQNNIIDRDGSTKRLTETEENIKHHIDKGDTMRRLLDMMEAKQTEDDDDLACYRDWRDIAFVLDRLFFVLFLIMTSLSTLCILAMKPGYHFIF